MKCPHCSYEDEYYTSNNAFQFGNRGTFYTFQPDLFVMQRGFNPHPETQPVYGCPNCGKLFMDI